MNISAVAPVVGIGLNWPQTICDSHFNLHQNKPEPFQRLGAGPCGGKIMGVSFAPSLVPHKIFIPQSVLSGWVPSWFHCIMPAKTAQKKY